ncbi:MAG: hypothetical protein NVV83_21475 [Afipia sp.]|nr:hypothetical protein [Afipia sp.]
MTDEAVKRIQELGGVRAMAISHPHFYSSMVDWSEALGGVPIHIHEANRPYVMRPSERVSYWSGETLDLGQGITLDPLRRALYWLDGAALARRGRQGRVDDRRHHHGGAGHALGELHVLVPQPDPAAGAGGAADRRLRRAFAYDRIYSAWWDRVMTSDAKARVHASAERYLGDPLTYR